MHGSPAIRKELMTSLNCTRVKAPTSTSGCGTQSNDSVTLKLDSRGVDDDDLAFTLLHEKLQKIKEKDQKHPKNNINPKKSKSLLSCTTHCLVGTFNIRTAREEYKRLELAATFIESNIQILGIQEHRIVHEEPIRMEKLNKGACLVTTSAWRNSSGASTGGVGFMVTREAFDAISLVKSYSNRVMTMSFNGNPKLTVITVYSPTEAATQDEAEEFHLVLRQAIADVPAHNLLQVVGDMNARLGKESSDDPGWYLHNRTNRNGELLRNTMLEGNLEATNHRFRKKPGKLWTFLSDATLTKGQIDYILVRRKWRNSVKNTEAYNFFSSLGSDHRVVVCKVKLSLRKSKRPPRKTFYDFSKLRVNEDLQQQYAVAVSNRFSCLMGENTDDGISATDKYDMLIQAVDTANKTLLSERPRRKRDDLASDSRVLESRQELFTAKEKLHTDPNENNRAAVQQKKEDLKAAYNTVSEEILRFKITQVEYTADRCKNKESWNLVNDITGKSKNNCGLIKGGSASERLKNWKEHFTKLLGHTPSVPDENINIHTIHPPQNISTEPFDILELQEAKKQIVEGKAYGEDGIPPEVIKRVDLDDIILSFCNNALAKGQVPDQWKLSNIVPVPKKGDLTEADNYRGISLTSIVGKTLNRMILNRVKPCLEKLLRDNQNGFRPGRSTTSHILALRRILEGAQAKNLSAVMLFIDFKKAFDSVHRGILMKILRAYGIPEMIVELIETMYTDTLAKVITPDGLTEVFKILAGVLQGDTLAPYLFIIVIDYLMTITFDDTEEVLGFTIKPARSRRVKAEKIADTEFADDVALITNTIKEAQSLLDSLEAAAKIVGLRINESKTKYIPINIQDVEHPAIHSISGEDIEKVDDFVYLGAWIASTEQDFKVRKAKAWAACHKMKKIWKSDLRRDLKIRLFQATVESILLYGSETWTMTASLLKRIDGCYTRMLRMALNVNWRQRLTNKVVYGYLPRVTSKIQARRMKLAGHIQRHEELIAHKLLLWEPLHGARGRGRPPLTFVDTIRRDTELDNTDEIRRLMTDRQLWRRTINSRTLKPP